MFLLKWSQTSCGCLEHTANFAQLRFGKFKELEL